MAFNPNLLVKLGPVGIAAEINSIVTTISSAPQPPQFWLYQAGNDTIADVVAAGYFQYFADWLNTLIYANGSFFRVGDVIYCACSDGNAWLMVTQIGSTIETEIQVVDANAVDTNAIQDLAVTTAKIDDNAVTLGKLAAGITPSHIVKFAGQPTTVGGAAAEAFVVNGVAATDLAFVQIVDDGTNNVTVKQAVCTLNTLTVTFSGNPGADCIFNYQILRAAA